MKSVLMSVVTLSLLTSMSSFAQTAPAPVDPSTAKKEKVIDNREARQEKRIEAGEKNGSLTGKEAAKLEKEQKHIEKMEQKAEADGVVTDKEAKKIEKAQNKASRDIKRKKHNKKDNK